MFLRHYWVINNGKRKKGNSSSDVLFTQGRNEEWDHSRINNSHFKSISRDLSKVRCYKCKEARHYKRNYPMLEANEKNKENDIANSVTSGEDDFKSMLVVTPKESSLSKWILDSGCSYYMCQTKTCFILLQMWNVVKF